MPRIQRVSPRVPVVVIGNKSDLRDDENDEVDFQPMEIKRVIKPLIKHYNVRDCFIPAS